MHHCYHYCFNGLSINLVTAALIKRPNAKENQQDTYTGILALNRGNRGKQVLRKLGFYNVIFLVPAEPYKIQSEVLV